MLFASIIYMLAGTCLPGSSSAAIYNSNPDCPDRLLQPYNAPNYRDRCMGGFYQVTQVAGLSLYDYNRCAIAKNNSNGSGGDAIPAACGTGTAQITPCYTVAFHYPGVVDHGPNAHHGYYAWHASSTGDC